MLAAISEVESEAQQERLVDLYGDALSQVEEQVKNLRLAVDRLAEVDTSIVEFLGGDDLVEVIEP